MEPLQRWRIRACLSSVLKLYVPRQYTVYSHSVSLYPCLNRNRYWQIATATWQNVRSNLWLVYHLLGEAILSICFIGQKLKLNTILCYLSFLRFSELCNDIDYIILKFVVGKLLFFPRGVYLASLLFTDDEKLLVTLDENIPIIEVDDNHPSTFLQDFCWLMKV